MDCWKCSLWYSIVASQLLYIRLHECCKQLKRPVAVIPQCRYPETRSLETTGMSSFSLSLLCASNFLSVGFTLFLYVFLTFFLSILGMCKQEPSQHFAFPPVPFLPCTLMRRESRPQRCAHRHDNLSLTQRPTQTMGPMHVAKRRGREG